MPSIRPTTSRDRVFVSYTLADTQWIDLLRLQLAPDIRNSRLDYFDDRETPSGGLWREQITTAIASARVAVLLVSPTFFASSFIQDVELPPILAAAANGELTILWVPIEGKFSGEAALPGAAQLTKHRAISDPARPLATLVLSERQLVIGRLCREIERLLRPTPFRSRADGGELTTGTGFAGYPEASEVGHSTVTPAGPPSEDDYRDNSPASADYPAPSEVGYSTVAPAGPPREDDYRDNSPASANYPTPSEVGYSTMAPAGPPREEDYWANSPGPDYPATIAIKGLKTKQSGPPPADGRHASIPTQEGLPTADPDLEPSRSGFVSGVAGYSPEYCGLGTRDDVADHLGVEELARRLAELAALRETKLPLAVGIFGNWGSGKSHFMNLIDGNLRRLASQERERNTVGEGKWCEQIVPIYFNAWHYADTNLWASLVTEIFDRLFAHLRPTPDKLSQVQNLLEEASGVTKRATQQLRQAHSETQKARNDLVVAKAECLEQKNTVKNMTEGLSNLLTDLDTSDLGQHITELLGVSMEVTTLSELQSVLSEVRSEGTVSRAWKVFWRRPGRGRRVLWALVVTIVLPVLAWIIFHFAGLLQGVYQIVLPFCMGLGGLLAKVRPIWLEVRRHRKELEDLEKKAESARAEAVRTPDLKRAQAALTEAEDSEAIARRRLMAAEAREEQLKGEASALSPERLLGRFIEQRSQSSDYRGQLGLVGLARRDFQELSDLFADTNALKDRLKKKDSLDSLRARQIDELSKSVDRIVLFVDDLDRCQPEKVVDVLQAVHLLLAFPLFAVFVGVDQRCLKQSLRMTFKGLLTPEIENSNSGNPTSLAFRAEDVPATPLDYLEKIFHIPFHIPSMSDTGFENLIENLTYQPIGDVNTAQDALGAFPLKSSATANAPPEFKIRDVVSLAEPAHVPSNVEIKAETATPLIGSAPLYRWELDALKECHSLIPTPRGAKRLLNTYRLVRAGIPEAEWDLFRGDQKTSGEFRLAIFLLAAAAGYPALTRDWFMMFRENGLAMAMASTADAIAADPHEVASKKLFAVYDRTVRYMSMDVSQESLDKWTERVQRFAFLI